MIRKLSVDELDRLRLAKEWAIDRFFQKPNGRDIVGVGIGLKFRDNREIGFPCVRIYVSNKPGSSDLIPSPIPAEILGVLTDVIDIGRQFTIGNRLVRAADDEQSPGRQTPEPVYGPGSSIGPKLNGDPNVGKAISGTLGAVLYGRAGNGPTRTFILSCNHVLSSKGRIPADTPIFSPAPADGPNGKAIAAATAAVKIERKQTDLQGERNEVDCAAAQILPGVEVDRRFRIGENRELEDVDVFWDHAKAGMPPLGARVVKVGKATGVTEGTIVDIDADILVDYSFGTFRFVNQILIKATDKVFAGDGDSGSVAVMTKDENIEHPTPAALAVVFAPLGKYTAACPIDKAIARLGRELNVPLSLAPSAVAVGNPGGR